ncbi:helix-turn-helix domain-containing protein [Nonomuraea angiospora]|uniref:helix-turn-helix domain-containing protein n=1 Tax=Nonomuraea angiospora TaxID=46172 RepID=UPI003F54ADFB
MWTSNAASPALASGNLAAILKAYRHTASVTQAALAAELGYDTTCISMLENGRRAITDVPTLRRLAQHLGVPPRVLGVTDSADADFHLHDQIWGIDHSAGLFGTRIRRARHGRTRSPSGSSARPGANASMVHGERHLRQILAEYERQHNQHRPHQALSLRQPVHDPVEVVDLTARTERRNVVCGLIPEYRRAA